MDRSLGLPLAIFGMLGLDVSTQEVIIVMIPSTNSFVNIRALHTLHIIALLLANPQINRFSVLTQLLKKKQLPVKGR